MFKINLANFIDYLEPVVKTAGSLLLKHFSNKDLKIFNKNNLDFTSEADLVCEEYLIKKLNILLPEAGVLSEELFFKNNNLGKNLNKEYCWIIDPLDGTRNFINNIPIFAISIALKYKNKIILGIIYEPVNNKISYAYKKDNLYINNLANKKHINNTILVSNISNFKINKLSDLNNIIYRKLGSSVIEQAYIANKSIDVICYSGLAIWDISAGSFLIESNNGNFSIITHSSNINNELLVNKCSNSLFADNVFSDNNIYIAGYGDFYSKLKDLFEIKL